MVLSHEKHGRSKVGMSLLKPLIIFKVESELAVLTPIGRPGAGTSLYDELRVGDSHVGLALVEFDMGAAGGTS